MITPMEAVDRMMKCTLTLLLALNAAVLAFAGCTQNQSEPPHHEPHAAAAPPKARRDALIYYLDQKSVGVSGIAFLHYDTELGRCKALKVPYTPLSSSDVRKLKSGRIRTWQGKHQYANRTDHWEAVTASGSMQSKLCDFVGVTEVSKKKIEIPGKSYSLNLTKGTGTLQINPPGSPVPALLPVTKKREAAMERKSAELGMMKLGKSEVAGQPCVRWKITQKVAAMARIVCIWAGGMRWGYARVPGGGINLSYKPIDGTPPPFSRTVTTREMLVGHLPGHGEAFQVPSDIKLRKVEAAPTGSSP